MNQSLNQHINRLPMHKGRMEVLLAELLSIEPSLVADDCLMMPQGLAARSYCKDVLFARLGKSEKTGYLIELALNREGLYDMIPKSLCHPPHFTETYQNIDALVEDSHRLKKEEDTARRFFLPFEQCFLQQRIEIEEMERRYMTGFLSEPQKKMMDSFWLDVKDVADTYKAVLFYMLPLAHHIAGNLALMEQCFETLLLDKVVIQYLAPQEVVFDPALTPSLGDAELGVHCILGNHVNEDVPIAHVSIGPLALADMADYLPDGKKTALLVVLYDFFFPLEVEIETEIVLAPHEEGFRLSDNPATARLGYSTIL